MKGDITFKILDKLKDGGMVGVNLISAILVSGYGASMSKIDFEYDKRERAYETHKFKADELRQRKKRLHSILYKMKHDGLIEQADKEKDKFTLSKLGKNRLSQLKKRLPARSYKVKKHNYLTIVSFDVPEKLRRKRDWLREVVRNLGFEMVHKSVWIGKIKISKEFLLDLENLKILEYVEILEVNKTGTLEKPK